MLEVNKVVTLRGYSKINDVTIKVFEATVESTNPDQMSFNHYVTNYKLYGDKSNRAQVNLDGVEFEDAAYAFKESLKSESTSTTSETAV